MINGNSGVQYFRGGVLVLSNKKPHGGSEVHKGVYFKSKTMLLNTDFDWNSEDIRELMDGELRKSTDNISAEVWRGTMAFSCSLHVTVRHVGRGKLFFMIRGA